MTHIIKIIYVSGREEIIFFFDDDERNAFLKEFRDKYKNNKNPFVEVDNNGQPLLINLNNVETIYPITNAEKNQKINQ